MRTFEFKDDKSNKFWNIELKGSKFNVTFGKIGTKGQTQTKEFDDAKKAKAAHDKLVTEKTDKGYVETTGGKTPAKKEEEEE
jgi:predicted DNA-binding WGR domain protein